MLDNTIGSLLKYILVLLAIYQVKAQLPISLISDSDSISDAAGVPSTDSVLSEVGSVSNGEGIGSIEPVFSEASSVSKSVGVSSSDSILAKTGSISKTIGTSTDAAAAVAASASEEVGSSSADAAAAAAASDSKGSGASSASAAAAAAASASRREGASSAATAAAAASASRGAGASSAVAAADAAANAGDSSSAAAAASAASASKGAGFSFVKPVQIPKPLPVLLPDPIPYPLPKPSCDSNPQYVVIPQYIPSGSFFANDPRVTLFTNAFLDAVYSTDILREVFDISQIPVELFAEFKKRYTAENAAQLGVPNGNRIAECLYNSIMKNFGCPECPRLTLGILSRIYANSVVHALFVHDYLSTDNAAFLGSAFAQSIAYSASVYMNSDPTSKLLPLAEGTTNFLAYVEPNVVQTADIYAFYLSNEYFVAAVNYRWL